MRRFHNLFVVFYYGDQIKENYMSGTGGAHTEGREIRTEFLLANFKQSGHEQNLGKMGF